MADLMTVAYARARLDGSDRGSRTLPGPQDTLPGPQDIPPVMDLLAG